MKISNIHTKRGNNAMNSLTPNIQIERFSRFCHTCFFYHFFLCWSILKHISDVVSCHPCRFHISICSSVPAVLTFSLVFKATQRVCNCYFVLFSGPTLWHKLTFPFCFTPGDMTWTTWFRRV